MYAKQIAVMKGQAWNVVETLKTPDLGPLELTRRARVCVWDDIVEIPIAVPLRAPSAEMRRRQSGRPTRLDEEHEALPARAERLEQSVLADEEVLVPALEQLSGLERREQSVLDEERGELSGLLG